MIGIYMLKDGDEVVYVGKSKDIHKRILQHSLSEKIFDNHSFVECSEELLESTEISYIQMLAPKYNIQYKLTQDNTVRFACKTMKIIQVDNDTHEKIKLLAKEKGMTMKGYLKIIAERDIKEMGK